MPELNTKLIEACQRYINDPSEKREQAIRDLLLRWIPCSEKLPIGPEDYGSDSQVLVTIKYYDDEYEVSLGEYWDKAVGPEHGWGRGSIGEVIAWQPKPLPYKEDGDG